MDVIKDFLVLEKEEQSKRKKKILVVDDSDFMRMKMVQLLEKDYDLIEAGSSISAIKKIAVNRPNLVLLDYEMPVCDGRQALEMIRSDKDIADIPLFLLLFQPSFHLSTQHIPISALFTYIRQTQKNTTQSFSKLCGSILLVSF